MDGKTVWNDYLRGHQMVGRSVMTSSRRESLRMRMRLHNPMRDPEVAKRVTEKLRGKPRTKSVEGLRNIAAAARRRMLSDQNPMRNPEVHRKAASKWLAREVSKNELHFRDWAEERGLGLQHVSGHLWLRNMTPDFRVPGQKKCLEVSQREVFVGKRIKRTAETYGLDRIRRMVATKWRCLVVFKRDHRGAIPEELADVIRDFASPESSWSGVWDYDRLRRFDASKGDFESTTSPARP